MKKVTVLVITCFLLSIPSLAICGSNSNPDDWTGNIDFFLGAKALDEDDWEPVDEHSEVGLLLDFKQKSWPVSIAVDYLYSWDDDEESSYVPGYGLVNFDADGSTSELCIGVRKIWDNFKHVRPFFGGGIAFIWAELEVEVLGVSVSDDDMGTGLWLGGGVYWTLPEHFNIGLQLRWSWAEVTLLDIDGEAGGGHAGLLLGYHW